MVTGFYNRFCSSPLIDSSCCSQQPDKAVTFDLLKAFSTMASNLNQTSFLLLNLLVVDMIVTMETWLKGYRWAEHPGFLLVVVGTGFRN